MLLSISFTTCGVSLMSKKLMRENPMREPMPMPMPERVRKYFGDPKVAYAAS